MSAPPSQWGTALERADSIGYDGIFSSETAHDPFLQLMPGAETRSAQVGTAIAVAFARSPMTVAYTAWDLASLSGGRFLLGLGSQIRAHITRRFSMEWSKPGPRMREYVAALRAIFEAWQTGSRLDFRGDFYSFTLMTPFFDPGPIDHPSVPIYIAGVGEYMCRLAGEVCDGFHVHPFHTERYLDEVVLPRVDEGAVATGRTRSDIDLASSVFVVTGSTGDEMDRAAAAVRQQIAFYASTPAYRGVLETHGWDIGDQLTSLSKKGEWQAMANVIDDDILHNVAVVAPLDELPTALAHRYAGRLDRIGLYEVVMPSIKPEAMADLVSAIRSESQVIDGSNGAGES